MQILQPVFTNVLLFGLVVALLSSAMPFLLDMLALKHLPRHVFGVLMSASPAVSALAGWLILGEYLNGLQWLGIAGISVACLGSALASRESTKESTT